MDAEPTLDCQGCGEVVKHLTWAEARQVAAAPYNYIVFCHVCRSAGYHLVP